MPVVPEVRVRLFGSFQIGIDGLDLGRPCSRKAQQLLGLVLLTPDHVVTREAAAECLWPEASADRSKKAIRQVLWQIHQTTDPAAGPGQRLVLTEGDVIRINPSRRVWVDVDAFAEAVHGAPSIGRPLTDSELADLGRAAGLRRGPLLCGCFEDWCIVQREHLDDQYISLLDRLSLAYEDRDDLYQAIRWAWALLDIEPAHERSHRRLMRLHYLTDDRTRALRQYRRCRWILEHDLGVRPSPRTEALAAAISADLGAAPEVAALAEDGVEGLESPGRITDLRPVPAETAITDRIDSLRAELGALRASVDAMRDQVRRALV